MDIDYNLVANNLLKQTFSTWINPELQRRRKDNRLPDNFSLRYAQVLFTVDGKNVIRINEEIKATIKGKINRNIVKGEAIFEKDIDEIISLDLINEEKDFGHISIGRLRDSWYVAFSFEYSVEKSKTLYVMAQEFLHSASESYNSLRYRAMIECLSIAAENFVKARIFMYPDADIRKTKKHGMIQGKANFHANTTGIIKTEFRDTFNKLMKLRDKARYSSSFEINKDEALSFLSIVQELEKELQTLLSVPYAKS